MKAQTSKAFSFHLSWLKFFSTFLLPFCRLFVLGCPCCVLRPTKSRRGISRLSLLRRSGHGRNSLPMIRSWGLSRDARSRDLNNNNKPRRYTLESKAWTSSHSAGRPIGTGKARSVWLEGLFTQKILVHPKKKSEKIKGFHWGFKNSYTLFGIEQIPDFSV